MTLRDIQLWIAQQEVTLDLEGKVRNDIGLSISRSAVRIHGWGTGENEWQYESESGATIEEALQKLKDKFQTRERRIQSLREQAKNLLREATKLEKEGSK